MRRLETQSGVVAKTLTTPAIVDATTLSIGESPLAFPPPAPPLDTLKGFRATVFPSTLEVMRALLNAATAVASLAMVAPALAPRRRRLASKAACEERSWFTQIDRRHILHGSGRSRNLFVLLYTTATILSGSTRSRMQQQQSLACGPF